MAERRMFSRNLLSGDQFLDLSASAQILYIHLCLDADDDGFTGRARAIMRMLGTGQEDLAELIKREFLIPFESGIYVIRHWRMQNSIRKDRYTQTVHRQEMENLVILPDGSYTMKQAGAEDHLQAESHETEVDHLVQPDVSAAQRVEETEEQSIIPTLAEVQQYARSRDSSSSPEKFFNYYSAQNWRRGKYRIEDWKAAFRCWESREKDFQSFPKGGMKLLPIQQYSQRDYSGMEETMDQMIARLDAELSRNGAGQEL